MKPESNILDRADHKTGYTVPDHYFADFRTRIMDNLPEYPSVKPQQVSMWTRVKPYLYMAAMFAGIWCMMKMFHMMTTSDLNFDNPPESVVMAMASADHHEWIPVISDDSEMFILEDDMCSQYDNIDDFTEDFNQSGL